MCRQQIRVRPVFKRDALTADKSFAKVENNYSSVLDFILWYNLSFEFEIAKIYNMCLWKRFRYVFKRRAFLTSYRKQFIGGPALSIKVCLCFQT